MARSNHELSAKLEKANGGRRVVAERIEHEAPATTTSTDPYTIQMSELHAIKEVAQIFLAAGMFPGVKSLAQAVTKILAGRELGMGPFQSMRNINVINGQCEFTSAYMAAKIKGSGVYDFYVVKRDESGTTLVFTKNGKPIAGDSKVSFTRDEAAALGLIGKDNYKKQAATMLYWRAVSKGARMHCPHLYGGAAYVLGEISGSDVNTAEVIDVTPPEAPLTLELEDEPEPEPDPEPVIPDDVGETVFQVLPNIKPSRYSGMTLREISSQFPDTIGQVLRSPTLLKKLHPRIQDALQRFDGELEIARRLDAEGPDSDMYLEFQLDE